VLQLNNRRWRLPRHIVNGILVTEPVRALDRIVHVPSPVVLVHVAQGRVDAALGRDRVTSGREQLRYAGSVEAGLRKAEGGSQAGASSSYNNCIVLVVLSRRSIDEMR
jgi:hypothetical protein